MAKSVKGHSAKIETLAGKVLSKKGSSKTAKRLAGAVLAHADGKPNKKAKKK